MTLLDLRASLSALAPPTTDDARSRDLFVRRVDRWLTDADTVEQLIHDLNRILGQVWFSTPDLHQRVFEACDVFARHARTLGGMTVNERLYTFGLVDRWDQASEPARLAIRSKIDAALE